MPKKRVKAPGALLGYTLNITEGEKRGEWIVERCRMDAHRKEADDRFLFKGEEADVVQRVIDHATAAVEGGKSFAADVLRDHKRLYVVNVDGVHDYRRTNFLPATRLLRRLESDDKE